MHLIWSPVRPCVLQDHMRKMIEVAEEHKKRKVSTKLIKDIYNAGTEDQAQKCINLIPLEKGRNYW